MIKKCNQKCLKCPFLKEETSNQLGIRFFCKLDSYELVLTSLEEEVVCQLLKDKTINNG